MAEQPISNAGLSPLTDADDRLRAAIANVRKLLPAQGPIQTFIHHNTLHSFEHLSFEDAVEQAGSIYDARSYLSEERYRELFAAKRIAQEDLELELRPFLDEERTFVLPSLSRDAFRRALIRAGIEEQDERVTDWRAREGILKLRSDLSTPIRTRLIDETLSWLDELRKRDPAKFVESLRSYGIEPEEIENAKQFAESSKVSGRLESTVASVLWRLSLRGARKLGEQAPVLLRHHRDALLELTGRDIFQMISHILIQLSSAFADQGVSYWPMPARDQGFLRATQLLLGQDYIPTVPWIKRAEQMFREICPAERGSSAALRELLDRLGVEEGEWESYLTQSALAFRGWAGIFALFEQKRDLPHERPAPFSLEEFLTVEVLLLAAAIGEIAEEAMLGTVSLTALRENCLLRRHVPLGSSRQDARAAIVFQSAQILGLSPKLLESPSTFEAIIRETAAFPQIVRQRIWHSAYERTFRSGVFAALKNHRRTSPRAGKPASKMQIVFCIDEREESLRRHIEELDPRVETFGYPGFFNLALSYKAVHQLHAQHLYPIALEQQLIVEQSEQSRHVRSNFIRKIFGYAGRETHHLSRTAVRGSLLAATLGHFTLIPFLLRTFSPAWAGRFHELLLEPEVRKAGFDVQSLGDKLSGEELSEKIADSLAGLFRTIGIAATETPFFVIMGHGSSSLNNPHESAHDCGACGGHRGAINARLFARFANRPEIRQKLRARGVELGDGTYVVGAYHDTCDDTISLFDEELWPETCRAIFPELRKLLVTASGRNALERSRRFLNTPRGTTVAGAVRLMRHRAEDFSEPRPEYGHATNAVAIIGRRSETRGLFLDRRVFLCSYDNRLDEDGAILQSLLSATVPVCAGINLEYYFSFVDPHAYGSGTKLPHNIVGYLGVMDGAESDLRTGLPWQMVEIHEPVRLTMIVEAPPALVADILSRLPKVKQLLDNRWFWLASVHPETREYSLYQNGSFDVCSVPDLKLPSSDDSLSYCATGPHHLPFAEVNTSEVDA